MSGEVPHPAPRCDFCKAEIAPFGFAPPPRLGLVVRRPIKTCAAPDCRAQGRARVAALVAAHDPLAKVRKARPDHARVTAQADLFGA